jgi:hypothetical protein
VAGLTKGAIMPMAKCTPPVEAFDTNVYRHRDWIRQTSIDLGAISLDVTQCGADSHVEEDAIEGTCLGQPWQADEEPRVCGFDGQLTTTVAQRTHSFQVPAASANLRVSLNGTSRTSLPVNVDYYVRFGAAPTTSVYDCAGSATGNFGTCNFPSPQAGTWYVLLVRVPGANTYAVDYQVTATETAPAPAVADSDDDGVLDPLDNCLLDANPPQLDPDEDGCGNACDGDFNQSGMVEAVDIGLLKAAYLTSEGQPGYDPVVDLNGDGTVNSTDLGLFKASYLLAPGPSGLPPELKTFPACP